MTTEKSPGEKPAAETEAKSVKELWLQLSPGIRIGYVIGVAMLVTCVVIASRMPPPGKWWLNVLLCLFGLAAGWTLGVLLSPMTAKEETKFTGYGKALSAFVTGFVVAKLEFLMKDFSLARTDPEVMVGRILLFATTFIVGFQSTFMARWTTRPKNGPGPRKFYGRRSRRRTDPVSTSTGS